MNTSRVVVPWLEVPTGDGRIGDCRDAAGTLSGRVPTEAAAQEDRPRRRRTRARVFWSGTTLTLRRPELTTAPAVRRTTILARPAGSPRSVNVPLAERWKRSTFGALRERRGAEPEVALRAGTLSTMSTLRSFIGRP